MFSHCYNVYVDVVAIIAKTYDLRSNVSVKRSSATIRAIVDSDHKRAFSVAMWSNYFTLKLYDPYLNVFLCVIVFLPTSSR